MADNSDLVLPCGLTSKGCKTATGTFIWEVPKDLCPLAFTRESSGLVMASGDGTEVFMSNDGSLVRLILGSPTSSCDKVVRSTNYDNIFVFELIRSPLGIILNQREAFSRQVSGPNVEIISYVKNRDDFLFNTMFTQLREEFNYVKERDCESRMRTSRLEFYAQHTDPGLVTFFLGNNTFATSAGRNYFHYSHL